jgi:hypothetical protein
LDSVDAIFTANGTGTSVGLNVGSGKVLTVGGIASHAAGSAAAPTITATGDTNTGIFFPAADTIAFAEGGAEAMRIDSSGNFGLGVTPSAWGSTYSRAIQISTQGAYIAGNTAGYSGGTYAWFGNNGYLDSSAVFRYTISTSACQYQQVANSHQWLYAPNGTAGGLISFSEAMRIDSSGNLLVGGTTPISIEKMLLQYPGNTKYGVTYNDTDTDAAGHVPVVFRRNGNTVGLITTTTSTTAYATSSDYRLKNTISPMTGALAKVALLKPCTYKWNVDGSDGQGFIAHELQEVVEGCVTGTKDATREEQYEVTPAVKDADGKVVTEAVMGTHTVPDYQGVDTSFLVATLTAAIQEQQALITSLTTRITALEST